MPETSPRVAIVHEWFSSYAGSERVVEQLLAAFPHADVFALVDFLPAEQRGFLAGRNVHTSFLQRLPWAKKRFRFYLPLMPLAIEQLDLRKYDIVLSSNHAVAKGVLTRADQLHVSYVHTPIRYAWDLHEDYVSPLGRGMKARFTRLVLHYLRMWDYAAAARVDRFVANSKYIARRIAKTYRREADVIYPPVDTTAFSLREQKEGFYLTASRLVPYKRVDIIVEAFSRMPKRQLVVIGDGPELERLKKIKSPNVQLLGHQPFDSLRDHMQRAKAFVFAADEDFGITPVEAQACGTPVIAFGRGGSLETVQDGVTGLFFAEQTAASVEAAIERFESMPGAFLPAAAKANAERFSIARFAGEITGYVNRAWEEFVK